MFGQRVAYSERSQEKKKKKKEKKKKNILS